MMPQCSFSLRRARPRSVAAPVLVALAALSALGASCADGEALTECERRLGLSLELCDALDGLSLPATLPPSPGNAFADDDDAANLGFGIYYDARFSSNQDMRCATCHEPEAFFDDDLPVSASSLGEVTRNSPTVLNTAWLALDERPVVFWDGRTDSVWSQPLFAFEAENEMRFTRLEIAHRVAQSYRTSYEAVFGPLPPLDDGARFPPAGKPGDSAFDGMSADDRHAVNLVVANIGKALDAYMRKIAAGRSRVDAYLDGEHDALSEAEERGLVVFARAGCMTCHSGPNLSDGAFHNAGVAASEGLPAERGRADGALVYAAALEDENAFTLASRYADPPSSGSAHDVPSVASLRDEAALPASLGAVRTPTLRNLRYSAPYGHNGRFATLDALLVHHLAGGEDEGFVGEVSPLLERVVLTDDERADLATFLLALDGEYPLPPWNNWPDR